MYLQVSSGVIIIIIIIIITIITIMIITTYLLCIYWYFYPSMASIACSLCFLGQEPECLVALEELEKHVYSSFRHCYIFTGITRPLLLWLEARVPSGSSGTPVLTGVL